MSERDFPTLRAPGSIPKINSIFDFTAEALGQLRLWLEMNPPSVGIQQVLGFSSFNATPAPPITTSETTTSTTYTDLATVGPQLTLLPKGKYILAFGAVLINSGGALNVNFVSPSVNGATPVDTDAIITDISVANVPGTRIVTASLPLDNNSVKLGYRVSAGTGTFQHRWLIALKYDNL